TTDAGSEKSKPDGKNACHNRAGRRYERVWQDETRKGKPTGDGSRLLGGRGRKPLRGRLPLLPLDVPVAERPRRQSSKLKRWVQLPPGTLSPGVHSRGVL